MNTLLFGFTRRHYYSLYSYSLNIMLRVHFSPGRDRACRHCWISCFLPPWENGRCQTNQPLDVTWTIQSNKKIRQCPKNISRNLGVGELGVKCVSVVFQCPSLNNKTFIEKYKSTICNNLQQWFKITTICLRLLTFFNGRRISNA